MDSTARAGDGVAAGGPMTGEIRITANQNPAEWTPFQAIRPLVMPIKNIAADFTGYGDSGHEGGLENS